MFCQTQKLTLTLVAWFLIWANLITCSRLVAALNCGEGGQRRGWCLDPEPLDYDMGMMSEMEKYRLMSSILVGKVEPWVVEIRAVEQWPMTVDNGKGGITCQYSGKYVATRALVVLAGNQLPTLKRNLYGRVGDMATRVHLVADGVLIGPKYHNGPGAYNPKEEEAVILSDPLMDTEGDYRAAAMAKGCPKARSILDWASLYWARFESRGLVWRQRIGLGQLSTGFTLLGPLGKNSVYGMKTRIDEVAGKDMSFTMGFTLLGPSFTMGFTLLGPLGNTSVFGMKERIDVIAGNGMSFPVYPDHAESPNENGSAASA